MTVTLTLKQAVDVAAGEKYAKIQPGSVVLVNEEDVLYFDPAVWQMESEKPKRKK